jgi:hydroxyacylglutathione hydrolase
MAVQIIPYRSGINTAYIIKDRGTMMFDGIPAKDSSMLAGILVKHGIQPEEIKLIVLSHGDFDHVGGAKELKNFTGADIAIHDKDRRNLEEGIFHWPEGVTRWGKASRAIFKPMMKKKAAFEGVKADLVLGDNDQALEEFGIRGKIVYTPGHTYGSVSVLLDSGEAFIGCLAHNRPPFVLKPGLPIYAEDLDLLKKSLANVIDRGAKVLYPGHGKPIPADKMKKFIH